MICESSVMTAASAPSASAALRRRPPSNIAVAVNRIERELFFREEDFPPREDRKYFHFLPGESDWETWLRQTEPEILITGWTTPPLPQSWLDDPDCPLRYVCHLTGSVRALVPRCFLERGGLVTNWGALVAPAVAEHALLLALMALRNQSAWTDNIHLQDSTRPPAYLLGTRSLYGRSVGIHGFGQVARELIHLLRPFGVSMFAYTQGVPPEAIRHHYVTPCSSLAELFSQSQIFFECEALNAETVGCVTADKLALLPDQAVFVNVGRGLVVDEFALLRESANSRIRVALDVVTNEPLDSENPFFSHAGSVLSPHIAGPTADNYRACSINAFNNIECYLSGLPLKAVISVAVYERST